MNRVIKFRAWDNKEKQFIGEWDTGNNSPVEFDCNGAVRVSYKELTCYCNPDSPCGGCADIYNDATDVTVEQFTGLLDKNGVEIYEGDILQERDNEDNPYSVFWCEDSAQWQTHCNESESCSVFEMNEALVEFAPYDVIIGNIHENPELLEAS